MKWCIYGAGAIGGVVGAHLSQAGEDVALVARGDHLRAIQAAGLRVRSPSGEHVLPLPAAESVSSFRLTDGDVVVLAVKSQQTAGALADLAAHAPAGAAVLCLQNGIDNERQAARYFDRVYAAAVTLLASYTKPGVVLAHAAPPTVGILLLGRYPVGRDEFTATAAGVLTNAGLKVDINGEVMRYKSLKLLRNLGNAIEIVCDGPAPAVLARMTVEAEAVFRAASLSLPDPGEDIPGPEPVHPSVPREGGSTWQSVLRGADSVETDYLNGEVALLGRLHAIAVPVNALMQRLAREVGSGRRPPRSLSEADVLGLL